MTSMIRPRANWKPRRRRCGRGKYLFYKEIVDFVREEGEKANVEKY